MTNKYKGYTYTIEQEEYCEHPYIDDDYAIGSLVTWLRNYELSTPDAFIDKRRKRFESPDEVHEACDNGELVFCAPVFAYIHGGITIRMGSMGNWPDQQWDCGFAGMVYVTRDAAKKEWPEHFKANGRIKNKKALIAACQSLCDSMVAVIDQWATGDVWYFTIFDPEGEEVDSCGMCYGHEYTQKEIESIIDHCIERGDVEKINWKHEVSSGIPAIGF